MTDGKRRPQIASLLVPLLVLAALGYSWIPSSKFDGTWLKVGGATDVPDEIKLSMRNHRFNMKHWDGAGIAHVIVPLDGQEHKLSSFGGTDTFYRASLNGTEVIVIKRVKALDATYPYEFTDTERWLLAEGGQKLVMSADGKEAIFKRAPLLRALFRGSL